MCDWVGYYGGVEVLVVEFWRGMIKRFGWGYGFEEVIVGFRWVLSCWFFSRFYVFSGF